MKIFYEGTDIYPSVSVNQCVYDSYGEQQGDSLRIVFNDTTDLWDTWKPAKGDKISASLGTCNTGDMYVISIRPENGFMCLRASSIPGTHNNRSNKSWQHVHFKQLCREIGARHGLECNFYGVDDQTYEYVNQQNKEDFVFLEERCVMEGCAFLVYNGRLIVYSESYIETAGSNNVLRIGSDVKFDYRDNSNDVYGVCMIKNGALVGTYSAGVTDRVLEKVLSVKISSQAEANRFAKNLLRFENKKMTEGVCYSNVFLPGYAAGSLVNLETAGASSWNVPVVMTHVRHDFVKATTKLWFRKILEE